MLFLEIVFPHSLHTLFVIFSNVGCIVCEEKNTKGHRSPWATAGIGLGKKQGSCNSAKPKAENLLPF